MWDGDVINVIKNILWTSISDYKNVVSEEKQGDLHINVAFT